VFNATPYRLGIVVVAAFLLLLAGLSTGYAEGEGVISGKVVNKTEGGGSIAGLEVVLQTFAHQSPGETLKTTTDQDGSFRFEKLVTASNYSYQAAVKYRDVTYSSDLIFFEKDETGKTSEISVFETTENTDSLLIERAHIIVGVDSETKTLPVMEILILRNQGSHVIRAGEPGKATLLLPMPAGAQNAQLAQELAAAAMETPDGFAYTGPILPGVNELLYSYELPYTSGRYDLSRSFPYPTQQISVLIPDKGIQVESPQLVAQPPRNIGGQSYLHLQGGELPSGSPIAIRLDGLPVPSPISAVTDALSWLWAQPAIIGLALVAIMALVFLRRRRSSSQEEESAPITDDFEEDEDELLDEEDSDAYEPEGTPRRRR
jgi:hypothetical protein